MNELTEFVDALKKYVQNLQMDFPTDILEISNKLSEFTKALSALTTKVAKLKVLDAILDILNKVVVSLDILVDVISSTSHKAETSSAHSASQSATHPAEGEKNTNQVTNT
ncbi:hypothetical protein Tco_1234743 [Tanacetum coccineum]